MEYESNKTMDTDLVKDWVAYYLEEGHTMLAVGNTVEATVGPAITGVLKEYSYEKKTWRILVDWQQPNFEQSFLGREEDGEWFLTTRIFGTVEAKLQGWEEGERVNWRGVFIPRKIFGTCEIEVSAETFQRLNEPAPLSPFGQALQGAVMLPPKKEKTRSPEKIPKKEKREPRVPVRGGKNRYTSQMVDKKHKNHGVSGCGDCSWGKYTYCGWCSLGCKKDNFFRRTGKRNIHTSTRVDRYVTNYVLV